MWGLVGACSAGLLGDALGYEDDSIPAGTARAGMTGGGRPAGGSSVRGAF